MRSEDALRRLGRVRRSGPYAYMTSCRLDEVELERRDGSELRLLVKRLDTRAAGRPDFLRNPARELAAYRLLGGADLGTPRCYARGRWWLALEALDAVPLWQRADLASWQRAARWAALLHDRFRGHPLRSRHLLRHDERHYRRWYRRARALVGPDLEALRQPTDAAISRLTRLPRTLVHGELYASNVLVGDARLTAVDWEMAAAGPGVIDLAALATGWHGARRSAIVAAFGPVDPADLAAAELVLALQWLGWGRGWDPPAEHRRDWLAEARAAAEVLT